MQFLPLNVVSLRVIHIAVSIGSSFVFTFLGGCYWDLNSQPHAW
jgi:hypothetical protein